MRSNYVMMVPTGEFGAAACHPHFYAIDRQGNLSIRLSEAVPFIRLTSAAAAFRVGVGQVGAVSPPYAVVGRYDAHSNGIELGFSGSCCIDFFCEQVLRPEVTNACFENPECPEALALASMTFEVESNRLALTPLCP